MMKGIKKVFLCISIFLLVCVFLVVTEAGSKLFSDCRLSSITHDKRLGWRFKKNYSPELKAKGPTKGIASLVSTAKALETETIHLTKTKRPQGLFF
jgi:hypothetical protein